MFGIKTSSIFKSRWIALLWAAGICWLAYDMIGPEQQEHPNQIAAALIADEGVRRAIDGL